MYFVPPDGIRSYTCTISGSVLVSGICISFSSGVKIILYTHEWLWFLYRVCGQSIADKRKKYSLIFRIADKHKHYRSAIKVLRYYLFRCT